ncbi:MAG: hypothetical protein J6Q96_02860 [Bacteroidales bacterium]|nr:hypothetical protein [Bacteroidales bacterium]
MNKQLDLGDWLRENPKTLTEQWKNGKLKEGWYYIECFDEPEHWIDLDFYRTSVYEKGVGYFSHNDWRGIAKVISPAPSYEKWQQLKEDNRIFEEKIDNLYMEIGQLKKLLKDYRETIYMAKGHRDAFLYMEFLNNTLFKINEVLK